MTIITAFKPLPSVEEGGSLILSKKEVDRLNHVFKSMVDRLEVGSVPPPREQGIDEAIELIELYVSGLPREKLRRVLEALSDSFPDGVVFFKNNQRRDKNGRYRKQ